MALKRKAMIGLEVELFTLDSEGKLVNEADKVIDTVKGKKVAEMVRPECAKTMLEIGTNPKIKIKESALEFLEDFRDVVELAQKEGVHLLPLGTHPGREMPQMRTSSWYDCQQVLLGKDELKKGGKVSGFHYHYTLPEGILEKKTKYIKAVGRSAARNVFLHQYNFLIATDPAVLTFCQSSPVWFGKHYAKDCRVLFYRDFSLGSDPSIHGMYYYHPLLGGLPNYEFTLQDLRVMADKRKAEFLRLLESKEYPTNEIAPFPSLKFMWGPMRVNKIGTFEYRGPDMNHPDIIFTVTSLLTSALRAIEKKDLKAMPSDIGIEEPFLLEDGVIHLPPHSTLKYLEYQSTLGGFESSEIKTYCTRLYDLVIKISGKAKSRNLELIRKMLKNGKTVSDEILDMIKKNGCDLKEEIPEDLLNHIALYHADKLSKSFDSLEKQFSRFTG